MSDEVLGRIMLELQQIGMRLGQLERAVVLLYEEGEGEEELAGLVERIGHVGHEE